MYLCGRFDRAVSSTAMTLVQQGLPGNAIPAGGLTWDPTGSFVLLGLSGSGQYMHLEPFSAFSAVLTSLGDDGDSNLIVGMPLALALDMTGAQLPITAAQFSRRGVVTQLTHPPVYCQ
jgi:hypothetical protein